MEWLSADTLHNFLGQALTNQVMQFGIAFGLAAHIHANKMKKEIGSQLGQVVEAINNLGRDLREDMADQAKRIELVENEVRILKQPQKGVANA